MTISFLIDPSLLQVAAGREWAFRAGGRLDLCTPTLSGRANETELLRPFLPDRTWNPVERSWRQVDSVDWIPSLPGTEPDVPVDTVADLVDRCREAVAEGRVLVARRPAVVDGLLARGQKIVVHGQPTFDRSLRQMILELGEDTAPLLFALFRPRRCRYMLLGPAVSRRLLDRGQSAEDLVLLDRGPLWGHGRLVTERSIVDHPPRLSRKQTRNPS